MKHISHLPRQGEIIGDLRQQIIDGIFAPGSRLPTRAELVRRFDASSVTVQRALDRLGDDGFVEARGRQGTFVSGHPPHLNRYGLVIANRRGTWPFFWSVLEQAAHGLFGAGPRAFAVFAGVAERDGDGYLRLLADVEARRLAGLVFASNPYWLEHSPILTTAGIPRVMIGDPGGMVASVVETYGADFLALALDHLVARGRRRVALIAVPGTPGRELEQFASGAAARGMRTCLEWQQAMVIDHPQWAGNLARLLMVPPADGRRPDALLITDDNLVEPAMRGLLAAGVRIPDDLEVVAHANFPRPSPSPVAITRLGYDARAILRQCVADLDRQRLAGSAATHSLVRPVFERDLPPEPPLVKDAP